MLSGMAANPIASTIVTCLPSEIHYLIITQIFIDWYQPVNGPPIPILTHDALHTLCNLGQASRFYRDLTGVFFKQANVRTSITRAIQSLPIYADYHSAHRALSGWNLDEGTLYYQRTILHEIIDSNCSACLRVLLENGLPATAVDSLGHSLLALAIMRRNSRVLKTLVTHVPPAAIVMPSPAITQDNSLLIQQAGSDLSLAIMTSDIDIFDIVYSRIEGNTDADIFMPYMKANLCHFIPTTMAQRLLNDGVNIADFKMPGYGSNEWHCAIWNSQGDEFLDWVLKHSKRDVDSSDYYGETALNDAVRSRKTATVRWLLKRGAEPERANRKGIPPFWHILKDIRQPASLARFRKMLRYISITKCRHERTCHTLTDYVWLALRVGHRLITEDQTLNKEDAKRERETINQRACHMVSLIEAPQARHRKILNRLNRGRPEEIDPYIQEQYEHANSWGRNRYFNKLTQIIRGKAQKPPRLEDYL